MDAAVVRQRHQRAPHAGVDPQRRSCRSPAAPCAADRPASVPRPLRSPLCRQVGEHPRREHDRASSSARSARRPRPARPTAAPARRSATAPTPARAASSPPASRPAPPRRARRRSSRSRRRSRPRRGRRACRARSACRRPGPAGRCRAGPPPPRSRPRRAGSASTPHRRGRRARRTAPRARTRRAAARPAGPSARPGPRRRRRASARGGHAKSGQEGQPWRPLSGAPARFTSRDPPETVSGISRRKKFRSSVREKFRYRVWVRPHRSSDNPPSSRTRSYSEADPPSPSNPG